MSAYEDFFPYVVPEVIGCPEPMVVHAVRNACIEFCEKSLVLVRDHDPVTIIENIVDYDLEPPTGYIVIKVMKAWVNNQQIDPLVPDFVREAAVYNRLFAEYQKQANTPQHYLQKSERSISLWPMPDRKIANGLTMRVALKPTRASTEIEDVIFEDYAETIASGALFKLMSNVGRPYTNIEMAAVHAGRFTQGINVARGRSLHGHVRSNLSVRLRRI